MDTKLFPRVKRDGPFAPPAPPSEPWVDGLVADKAALIDEVLPGWANRIDTTTLDMAKGCHCVLGQAFGGFDNGIFAIFGTYGMAGLRNHDIVFQERPGVRDAWVTEIERRSVK